MRRRSIYVRQRRKEMPSILETFDLPQMNPNCIARKDSTVVSQPLHLLNNKLIHELAGLMAERVEQEADANPDDRLRYAWMLTLNRSPTADELQLGRQLLDRLTDQWKQAAAEQAEKPQSGTADLKHKALADFCHALINSAAFLYID
jgi:hypothetical protein